MTRAQVIESLRRIGAEEGASRIAEAHGMSLHKALSGDRHLSIARTRRQIIACVAWTMGLSSVEAGHIFGVHHTTVLHHLRTREAELAR